MYFLEAGTSSEQLLFQKKNFLRGRCFLKTLTFFKKLALRDQFHSIDTFKTFH